MQPEVIHIGPLVISKVVFDAIIVLASVVTGGLITYLTTRAIETKKWREQKNDKRQEQRRIALERALEWIPPISIAVTNASLKASRFLKEGMSDNKFLQSWPRLLLTLAKLDLPMHLNVLLPPEVQKSTNDIIRQLDELQSFTLLSKPASKLNRDEWTSKLNLAMELIHTIDQNFEQLKGQLIDEYKRTFE